MSKNNKSWSNKVLDTIMLPELERKSLTENFSTPVLFFFAFAWIFSIAGLFFNVYIMATAAIHHDWNIYLAYGTSILIGLFIFYSLTIGTLRAQKAKRIYLEDIKDGNVDDETNYRYAKLFRRIALFGLLASLTIQLTLAKYTARENNNVLTSQEKIEHFLKIDSIATARENAVLSNQSTKKKRLEDEYKNRLANHPETAAIHAKIEAEKERYKSQLNLQNKTIAMKEKNAKSSEFDEVKRAAFKRDVVYRKETIIPKIEATHQNNLSKLKLKLTNASSGISKWYDEEIQILSSSDTSKSQRDILTQYHLDLILEREAKAKINEWITKGATCIFDIVSFLFFSWFGWKILIDFNSKDIYSNGYKPKSTKRSRKKKSRFKSFLNGIKGFFQPIDDQDFYKGKPKPKPTPPPAPKKKPKPKPTVGDKEIPFEIDKNTEKRLREKEQKNTPTLLVVDAEILDTSDTINTNTHSDRKNTLSRDEQIKTIKAARTSYLRQFNLKEQARKTIDTIDKDKLTQSAQKALNTALKHIEKLEKNGIKVTLIPNLGKLKIDY